MSDFEAGRGVFMTNYGDAPDTPHTSIDDPEFLRNWGKQVKQIEKEEMITHLRYLKRKMNYVIETFHKDLNKPALDSLLEVNSFLKESLKELKNDKD